MEEKEVTSTYNMLIQKAPNFAMAKGLLQEMREKGGMPNEITYFILINKLNNVQEGKGLIQEMKLHGLMPNEIIYSMLINKSRTLTEAKVFFEEMKSQGLQPDEITYNILINESTNFTEAKMFFTEMKSQGLQPNEITYTTLINKSDNLTEAKWFFAEMKTAGLKPNKIAYSILINKSNNLTEAKWFLEEMKAKGLKPDEIAYSTLINKSPNFTEAKGFLSEMKAKDFKPNGFIYNTLIKKSPTLSEAEGFFEEMTTIGLKPNKYTYRLLFNKIYSIKEIIALLKHIKTKGLLPQALPFIHLIRIKGVEKLHLNEKNIDSFISRPYFTLSSATSSLQQVKVIHEEMKQAGLAFNEIEYFTLINKAPNTELSQFFLQAMRKAGLRPIHIDYIDFKGYKSIQSQRISLKPITILIGANGSGKSNFLSFFDFLHQLQRENLQNYIALKGGTDNLFFNGNKHTPTLSFTLVFNKGGSGYTVELEANEQDGFSFTEEKLFYGTEEEKDVSRSARESRLKDSNYFMADFLIDRFTQLRKYNFYDTGPTSPFNKASHVENDRYFLYADGGNLAAFLLHIKNNHKLTYRRIVKIIQSIAPYFSDFYYPPHPTDYVRLQWKSLHSEVVFSASDLSDGTLRFIALTVAFMQPHLPDTIIIDEPSLGAHPSAIAKLAGMIRSAVAKGCQLIIATQSTDLISHFSPEDIVTVDQKDGASVFQRLHNEDWKAWLEDYTIDDLWKRNVITTGQPN